MPVYVLECPQCGYRFKGFVLTGAQKPKEWVCSQCDSREAEPIRQLPETHPLDAHPGQGCPCCG
ncbi:MAG: hypothetical protein ACXWTN_05465 [Methylosarcina sp.]